MNAPLQDPWPEALALATQAIGLSDPNPRVGCVIADAAGRVVGRGSTQQAGGPHAEVMALRDAAEHGAIVRGGTAWVTLEPCAHHGRTPPCANALVAAGLAAVHVAMIDPNPRVAGGGNAILQRAGIAVHVLDTDHPSARAAAELNVGFVSRMTRGRPWVRLKVAASLDGRTALPDGRSQWITGPEARADGHAFRARASVILTGVGTVLADDPLLTARHPAARRQPTLAVLDSTLRTPASARLLQERAGGGVRIYCAQPPAARRAALEAAGATVIEQPGDAGRVDLAAVLADLASLETNEIHVEAGAALHGALLAAGLVDELLLYVAPSLLGEGRPIAALPALPDLAAAPAFEFESCERVGADLRLRARRRADGASSQSLRK